MAQGCDYVVIGGGAAGCVVAARLSENPDCTVVLLEAGPRDLNPLLTVPGALPVVAAAQRFNWQDRTEAEPELGNRALPLSQARVLGGGTSINGMVYTRGQPGDFDRWRDLGCPGWGYEDVLPFFRRSENNERGADRWHGVDGPLRVTRGQSPLPLCEAFLAAGEAAGYRRVDDLCGDEQEGFGYGDVTVADGRRTSASTAFLKPAERRPNLTVVVGAQVSRIVVERGRAVAAEYCRDGAVHRLCAEREIVLCAGAIRSPQVLMLSGIGPAEELRRHGIAALHDAPEVGANLQNHVATKLQYAVTEPVSAYRYLNPGRALATGAQYAFLRGGYLAIAPTPICGFFRSDDGLAEPDMQVFMNPALYGRIDKGLYDLLPKQHGFTLALNQGRPWSRGDVRLASADPADAPRIFGRYFSDPRDLAALARAVARMRDLVLSGPLRRMVERELLPGPEVKGSDGIAADLRRNAGNHFHVAGTCRMGEDAGAPVDVRLRVKAVDALRVADASVMPALVNGNTAAPVMMIAERAAEMMAADAA